MTNNNNDMKSIVFRKKGLDTYMKEKLNADSLDDVVNVINLHHKPDEGSKFVQQWEKHKGRTLRGCANLNCLNHSEYDTLVGAHVKMVGEDDGRWYITPLCHVCNSDDNDDEMAVYKEDLALYTEIKDIKV